jgi:hypothetical protein
MAYNKIYLNQRILEIQNLILEYTSQGYTYKWVYRNVIEPRYHISYSTFNSYISKPIKKP